MLGGDLAGREHGGPGRDARPAAPPRGPAAATMAIASSSRHRDDLVEDGAVEDAGHERGADALDAVRPERAARRAPATRAGSTADHAARRAACSFRTSPTPVMVPPVPTPATNASSRPSVASRISSAVVRRWTSGFAGFSNCCGMKYSGCSRSSSCGREDRAAHALDGRREVDLGAEAREQPLALDAHVLRHREDQPVALHRRTPSPARCRCCRWSAPRSWRPA